MKLIAYIVNTIKRLQDRYKCQPPPHRLSFRRHSLQEAGGIVRPLKRSSIPYGLQ